MTDPIHPFVALIRSLARRKTDATEAATPTTAADTSTASHASVSAERPTASLRTRLRSRLAKVGPDPERARRTFVETILLWQLGDEVSHDPDFGDLVGKIAEQLHRDEQLGARLANLLAALAA